MNWESQIAEAFARHGDVVTCRVEDPVERNRKANKAKRDGVGGISHEKMLERSRRYRAKHLQECRKKVLKWQQENNKKHCQRCKAFREKKKAEKESQTHGL